MSIFRGIPAFILLVGLIFALSTGPTLLKSADDDEYRGLYINEFAFVINKEIAINETVGRVHFSALKLLVKELSGDRYRLLAHLMATNPDGHDQEVVANVRYLDSDGNVITSDDIDKAVEENDAKTLKLRVYVDRDTFSRIAALQLEIETWDD